MVDAIGAAVSALGVNARKIGVSANNIANMGSIGGTSPDAGPAAYTPQDVVSIADPTGGVTSRVIDRDPATVTAYDPNSPYADDKGQVAVPNVDLAEEVVGMKLADIAYRASLKVIQTASNMQKELLRRFDEKA
jgi:flagellar basal-body rod protein FlgC